MKSHHYTIRLQQRGIPPVVEQWLSEFGVEQYMGDGAIKIYFNHRSIRQMEKSMGAHFVRQNKKYLNAYMVESVSDGTLITASWRDKRIKH